MIYKEFTNWYYKAQCLYSNYDLCVHWFLETEFLYLKNNLLKQSRHNFFEALCLLVTQRFDSHDEISLEDSKIWRRW